MAPLTLPGFVSALDSAKSLLRDKASTERLEKAARRLTEYEDWLEMHHPRNARRNAMCAVRRRLEDRSAL